MGFDEDAYRYAVRNAFQHRGRADAGAVVGKVAALHKELDIKKAMPKIREIVARVNELSESELEAEYKKFEEAGFELKAREKSSELEELDWARDEPVVTRYAPNPNGPFHLGNARAAIMSHEYARKHNGKFMLRFDDTDPKVKRPIKNAEEVFRGDLEWLGCRIDEVHFASDRLEIYYKYMRDVLSRGLAYVCTCDTEEWRKKVAKKKACACREREPKGQLELFEKMLLNELREGEAVLRIKTELEHKDPSMRDWWAAKAVDKPDHPRVGSRYHVWPSYNFQCAIDDHELSVTLVIRGQEHTQNTEKQRFLYKYFGWKYPHVFHFGRVKLEGTMLSTSRIKEGIENGIYTGWDDPRLGTIKALRRRGYDSAAIRGIILEIGVKSSDTTVELSRLNALNKEYTDRNSERIVFISEPIQIEVIRCPETSVTRYGRQCLLNEGVQKFLVEKRDVAEFAEGSMFRLRDAYNVRVTKVGEMQIFAEFMGTIKIDKNIVPWIVGGTTVEIMMPNAKKIYGVCSDSLKEKARDEHVYLERLGYCRVDENGERSVSLWFTHK